VGKDVFEDSKKRNNEGELMSGDVTMFIQFSKDIKKEKIG
jgi:hypothetical protein